jgi:hypothetical protein
VLSTTSLYFKILRYTQPFLGPIKRANYIQILYFKILRYRQTLPDPVKVDEVLTDPLFKTPGSTSTRSRTTHATFIKILCFKILRNTQPLPGSLPGY